MNETTLDRLINLVVAQEICIETLTDRINKLEEEDRLRKEKGNKLALKIQESLTKNKAVTQLKETK